MPKVRHREYEAREFRGEGLANEFPDDIKRRDDGVFVCRFPAGHFALSHGDWVILDDEKHRPRLLVRKETFDKEWEVLGP